MPNRRHAAVYTQNQTNALSAYASLDQEGLTHCGLVTPNAVTELG